MSDASSRPAPWRPTDAMTVRATLVLDGEPLTLLPKRAPLGNSAPIRGRSLAVFPVGEGERELLLAALPELGCDPLEATLDPGGIAALAMLGLTETEALAARAALGCKTLLFWDGRRARLLG